MRPIPNIGSEGELRRELVFDHQSGLFQTTGDMPMSALRNHAAALAKIAALSKIPVVTTASVPQGPNRPLIPEIHQNAPHAKYVARWVGIKEFRDMLVDVRDKVGALKKSGRTPEEAVAAKPAAGYDAKWGQFVIDPPFFTMLAYEGRQKTKKTQSTNFHLQLKY
jgi:hypothetical protein